LKNKELDICFLFELKEEEEGRVFIESEAPKFSLFDEI
jgi:hypothetical protein